MEGECRESFRVQNSVNVRISLKLLLSQKERPFYETTPGGQCIRNLAYQRRNELETKNAVERIDGTKSWLLEKPNKINKLLAKLTKKKRGLKIRNRERERGRERKSERALARWLNG